MRVVHVPGEPLPADDPTAEPPVDRPARTLATTVDRADGPLSRVRGLMLRSVPEDYALAFPFDGPGRRWIHTAFVLEPIDVVWTVGGEVTRVETMPAWRGLAGATADCVLEFAAGTAADVVPGDVVRVTDETDETAEPETAAGPETTSRG